MALVEVVTPTGDTVGVQTGIAPPSDSFPVTAETTSILIVGRGVIVTGWTLYEATGAAGATAQLLHGDTAGGELGAGIQMAAGGMAGGPPGSGGIRFPSGVFLTVVAGSMTGAVYYRRLWER